MTWLYILIDIVILLIIVTLLFVAIYFWNKKTGLNIGSLSEFRNDSIYEKSYEDKKKKAHIEDIVEEEQTFIDDIDDNTEETMGGIYFSEGYGLEEGEENGN